MTSRDDYLNAMQERQGQQKTGEDKAAQLAGLIRDRDQRQGAELVGALTPRPHPFNPPPGETRAVENNTNTTKHY